MRIRKSVVLSFVFLFSFLTFLAGGDGNGEQKPVKKFKSGKWIVSNSNDLFYQKRHDKVEHEKVTVSVEQDGRIARSGFNRWTRVTAFTLKKTIVFTYPTNVKSLGLTTYSHSLGSTQQWLKLPSSNKIHQITDEQRGKYFIGDLTFEDVEIETPKHQRKFTYLLLEEDSEGWLIAAYNYPRFGKSEYSKRVIRFNRRFAIVEVQYFDDENELIKTLKNTEIEYFEGGMWRVIETKIENHKEGRETTIFVKERELDYYGPDPFTADFLKGK